MTEIGATELRKLQQKLERENERKLTKKSRRGFDGFGPFMQQKMASAMRECWRQSSTPRKLCAKRVDLGGGYSRCEGCNQKVPKTYIDHIVPCGSLLDAEFLTRLCVPSTGLQALCHECHKAKTNKENRIKKKQSSKKKTLKSDELEMDFY